VIEDMFALITGWAETRILVKTICYPYYPEMVTPGKNLSVTA
jgi:hypothetical protein